MYIIYVCVYMIMLYFQLGRPVEGLVVILDMDNAGTNVLWPPGQYTKVRS